MSNHGEIRDFEKDFGKVKPLQGSGALGLIGGVLGGAAKTIGRIGGKQLEELVVHLLIL